MSGAGNLDADSRPALSPHVRMRHDPARGGWVLLGPERVLMLDDTAAEILKLCDGAASIALIAGQLAERYAAPLGQVQGDVIEMLQNLRDKGMVLA